MVIYNFAERRAEYVRARESRDRQNAQKKCADSAGSRVEPKSQFSQYDDSGERQHKIHSVVLSLNNRFEDEQLASFFLICLWHFLNAIQ